MSQNATALIIGGGVMGSSIALELIKAGIKPTILEKGPYFSEASSASAGMICPHAVEFDDQAPKDILRETFTIYNDWIKEIEEISGISVQFVQEGMLRVVLSEKDQEQVKKKLSTNHHGVEWVNHESLKEMEKDVTEQNFGALYFPNEGQLNPSLLSKSLHKTLLLQGCEIKEGILVLNLIEEQGSIVGVHTASGNFFADFTIIAAGAWSTSLVSPFGLDLTVLPEKGEMANLFTPLVNLKRIIQGPEGIIVPRQNGSITIGATHENVGYDKQSTVFGQMEIYSQNSRLVPGLNRARINKTWAGLRPRTPDGLPYIGKIPTVKNLFAATGHYGIGILLAPITGRLICEELQNKEHVVDLTPYKPERLLQAKQ
jgi:glycine oxidase